MRLTPTARRLAAGLTVGAMVLVPAIAGSQAVSAEITVEPAGPKCDGITATGPEWDAYQAARAAQADAKVQYAKGSLGFFQKNGAADAVTALTSGEFVGDTHIGQSGDATDLKLMLESLKWIPVSSHLRNDDPARTDPGIAALRGVPQEGASMAELQVTDRLMAVAQYSANHQAAIEGLEHVVNDQAAENLAASWSSVGPNMYMRHSDSGNPLGPYQGWWFDEKDVWDTQTAGMTQAQRDAWLADESNHIYTLSSGEQTAAKTNFGHVGHYLTLADANSGARMTHTGFAIAESSSTGSFGAYASQTFSAGNWPAGSAWAPKAGEQTFTVTEYTNRLKAYVDQIDPAVHQANVDRTCEALLGSLKPTPSPSSSPSPSATPSATPTAPATAEPTPPATAAPSPSAEPKPTAPATATPTAPATAEPAPPATAAPSASAQPSATPSMSPAPTVTATPSPSAEPAPSPTTGQSQPKAKLNTSTNPPKPNTPKSSTPKPKKSGLAATGAGAQVLLPLAGGMVLAGAAVRRRRQA
ncbi:Ribonucleases G and E [Actinomyces bovis]|uniref:Ribonucleases G and E n=1 Tax=Actinomyces bovis TaxID=1658 RepID=A0ABY1VQZ5_9ACTO|nr:hypothetical protein [Actinomyces bovis]SPT54369.1 Ribonucleases G and E [Actinomyces bovis]VEG56097.1 Ribonucleases G and E [Actinomyces israelii]